jgi:hypothetical protein
LPLLSSLATIATLFLSPCPPARRPAGVRLNNEVKRTLDREVGLMKEMRHPNIILFMGVVLEPAAVVTGAF